MDDYFVYGGLPAVALMEDDGLKANYLKSQIQNVYLRDIVARYKVENRESLGELLDVLASGISALVNPLKLANTFKSVKHEDLPDKMIAKYIGYMQDAFLIKTAKRYDVKGKKYISTPFKIYFEDVGLRNAELDFRQIDEGHLLENIVYNELSARGHNVDVGVVEGVMRDGVKTVRYSSEIDFVVNAKKPGEKCYIQCTVNIDDEAKWDQELKPFLKVRNDFSRRIMLTKTKAKPWTDDLGILHIGIYDFLLSKNL